ncbi:HNH endonuclease [Pseudomonas palmensis]
MSTHINEDVPIVPIIYEGDSKIKVDEFAALADVSSSYWEKTSDGVLASLKKQIKDHYLAAQDYRCYYCRQRVVVTHNGAWDAEHIIPKDSHPRFMFEPRNLCVSCKDCNLQKSNKNVLVNRGRVTFPDKSQDYLLCHPFFDVYSEHVTVLREAGFYLPKTEKGRVLVETCGLLRFLYNFSNYEGVKDSIKSKIAKLTEALMNAEDSCAENFILDCIGSLVDEGKRKSREEGLRKMFADN